jgi:UDP-MurNAc hydroxylase
MRVRYVYSACVVVETADVTLITDPWFTPGAYEGSWFQYPPLERDPVDVLGAADFIYLSHIHPDHYDPVFLRRYLKVHPQTRLLVGETSPAHLARRMRADGFSPEVITSLTAGETRMEIHANTLLGGGMDIDTALVVACPGGRPTFALLPYSGSGLYPQTCQFPSEAELLAAAAAKRRRFLDMFAQYLGALEPTRAMPFAGKYWLGGPLRALNRYRGIPDASDAWAEHPERTVVLADGGDAFFDLTTLTASASRTAPYDPAEVDRYLSSVDFRGYAYETEIRRHDLPLLSLLRSAVRNARRAAPASAELWLCIRPRAFGKWLSFNVAGGEVEVLDDPSARAPRWEITLDDRHLFGLLTRLYHWNNAAIGSHLVYRRVPDAYDRATSHFLNFLHV